MSCTRNFALLATICTRNCLLRNTRINVVIRLRLNVLNGLRTMNAMNTLLRARRCRERAMSSRVIRVRSIIRAVTYQRLCPTSVGSVQGLCCNVFLLLIVLGLFCNRMSTIIFRYERIICLIRPSEICEAVRLIMRRLYGRLLLLIIRLIFNRRTGFICFGFTRGYVRHFDMFFQVEFVRLVSHFGEFLGLLLNVLIRFLIRRAIRQYCTGARRLIRIVKMGARRERTLRR